jgi:hypothetical protein
MPLSRVISKLIDMQEYADSQKIKYLKAQHFQYKEIHSYTYYRKEDTLHSNIMELIHQIATYKHD